MGFHTSVVFPFKGWLLFATLLTGGPAGAAELYWDTNGTTPGAGATVNGTWGVNSYWNMDAAGVLNSLRLATTLNDTLYFSAGTDATGNSTVTLSGAVSAGGLVVNQGSITLAGSSTPSLMLGTLGVSVGSGGSLGMSTSLASVLLAASQTWTNQSSNLFTTSSATAIAGTATTGSTFVLTTGVSGNTTLSGSLKNGSGGGVLGLIKIGAGSVRLSGSNNYSGSTVIMEGTLALGHASALGGGGDIPFSGGTLQFSTSNTSDLSARIVGSTSAMTLDTNGRTVTFAGSLAATNTGGLTKSGAGSLVFSAVRMRWLPVDLF